MHELSTGDIIGWLFVVSVLSACTGAVLWDLVRNTTRRIEEDDWPNPADDLDYDEAWDEEPMPGRCARSARAGAGEDEL
ncbi:hypothetical protein [Actinomadura nitritigenes]|uniref:hypothetical protein n=1 Tax=Actinomadura nitritigenes TaxID=134602 RepID=UPI003D94613B